MANEQTRQNCFVLKCYAALLVTKILQCGVHFGSSSKASALGKKWCLKTFLSTGWTDKATQTLGHHFFRTFRVLVLEPHFPWSRVVIVCFFHDWFPSCTYCLKQKKKKTPGAKQRFDDGDDKLDMRRFFDKRRMSLGNYTVEECFDARISVNGAVFVEKYHGEVCCRSFLMHARHPVEAGTELT